MMNERATEAGKSGYIGKDPGRKHFYMSIIKSIIRIVGSMALIGAGVGLGSNVLVIAGVCFLIAEAFGILEETE